MNTDYSGFLIIFLFSVFIAFLVVLLTNFIKRKNLEKINKLKKSTINEINLLVKQKEDHGSSKILKTLVKFIIFCFGSAFFIVALLPMYTLTIYALFIFLILGFLAIFIKKRFFK